MKLAIILGTRPEIIKLYSIIKECQKKDLDYFILHSGQHYSYELDKIFFEELKLTLPKYNINVGSGTHGAETGKMLIGIEEILLKEKPNVVLVQGDTNTVLAGGLAASKLHIDVGHVEAGLRSYDLKMPEEINRILTDHLSNYLFAPTLSSKNNLLKEGLKGNKIIVTGNTIADVITKYVKVANEKSNILKNYDLETNQYILATFHRQENVDNEEKLMGILGGLELLSNKLKLPIVLPIHPRTKKRLQEYNLSLPKGILAVTPLGFLEFLQLESNACLVLTDSGGVQEETCILKVPCVTLRDNTERPETLEVGSNILAGTTKDRILECSLEMIKKNKNWESPFGNGKAGKSIISYLVSKYI
ncbi:MAG TPA: UDP-N-acetylglucosamine 2-epimerase (non-hydrolyzing) [Methanofastidiosum sp.]|nr:UDP-N-acetylglucosamine 2-epimerase (non-hydrolyzing) [Methanofastidiosum sp.]